jgi:transposase
VKMKVKQVAALPEGLEVTDIEAIDEVLTITAVSTQLSPCCPLCGTPARRVHSHYTRQITDLPCSGQQVRLLVQVRKCFCEVPDCARKIFVERLTPFVEPWARVTRRLYQIVQILGLADFRQTWHPCDGSLRDTDLPIDYSPAHHGAAYRVGRAGLTDWDR